VNRPETSSGKRRPRGALLQLDVVVRVSLYRVARTRYQVESSDKNREKSVTLAYESRTTYPSGNTIRWAVRLGRYSLDNGSREPKDQLIEVTISSGIDFTAPE
jgi:hypothetical protein